MISLVGSVSPRRAYPADPKTCNHYGPQESHICRGLVYFACSSCGAAVRTVWGSPASITALAALGLGKMPLCQVRVA